MAGKLIILAVEFGMGRLLFVTKIWFPAYWMLLQYLQHWPRILYCHVEWLSEG
jgi:hypothetical protein